MWISWAEAFGLALLPFLDFTRSFTLFPCLYLAAQYIFLWVVFFPAVIVIFYYVSVQMCNKITMQRIGDGDDFRWLAGNIQMCTYKRLHGVAGDVDIVVVVVSS